MYDLYWCSSGDDGKSRALQLQLLLKRLDPFASSSVDCVRERAVRTVLALLREFLALCTPGRCSLGCSGSCTHLRSTSDAGQSGTAGNFSMLTRSSIPISPLSHWA